MSSFTRFVSLGLQDADRRIAAALSSYSLAPIDRYLRDSVIVTTIDRATIRLSDWWHASRLHDATASLREDVSRASWPARYRTLASLLLIAAATNVALTLTQGPRPGWFWMVIPAMVIAFAGLLFAGSRR